MKNFCDELVRCHNEAIGGCRRFIIDKYGRIEKDYGFVPNRVLHPGVVLNSEERRVGQVCISKIC